MQKIKFIRYLVPLFLLIIVYYIVMYSKSESEDSNFRVGIIADQSGFMSGHGQSVEMGARLAVKTLNEAGGILGKEVELIILDGQSDPTATANRARELIQRHNVSVILGTGTSAATLSAIGPAIEGETAFIYALDGEIKTCSPQQPELLNPYVFASGFTERMAVLPLMEFLVSKVEKPVSETSIYFIGGDYVYPKTTNAYAINVAEKLGLKVVGDEYSDTATTDYSPIIRKIQQAKPDILIVTNPGASGVTFMKQAKQFNLDRNILISGFATFDQEAIGAMGNFSEGVYVINRYSNQLTNDKNNQFVTAFRNEFPKEKLLPGPTAAAGSYGVLMLVSEAVKSSNDVSSTGVIKGLPGLTVNLPQGEVTVSKANHIFEQPLYIMEIENQEYKVVSTTKKLTHPGFEGCSVK